MSNDLQLIDAVKQEDLAAIKAFVVAKDTINQRDDNGWTALNWAAGKGQLETVKLLLEHGADVFQTGRDQRTPYKIALAAGHVEVSKILREAEEKAGRDHSNQEAREFCKAYYLKAFREFPGWPDGPQPSAQEDSENGAGGNGKADAEDDGVAFLHSDLTVTKSMWHDEDVIFDDVTPEWREFCANVLEFKVADDLDLIAQS